MAAVPFDRGFRAAAEEAGLAAAVEDAGLEVGAALAAPPVAVGLAAAEDDGLEVADAVRAAAVFGDAVELRRENISFRGCKWDPEVKLNQRKLI